MLNKRISGTTRVLGKSQGYLGLHIRDEDQGGTPVMVSAWEPTPAEIERIISGAPILLEVVGTGHPPIKLDVGDRPNE